MAGSYSLLYVLMVGLPSVWICFFHFHFLAHKRKKRCQSTLSTASLPQRIFTYIPHGVKCNHCLIDLAALYKSLRQDAREAILYAAERTGEASVNGCDYQM